MKGFGLSGSPDARSQRRFATVVFLTGALVSFLSGLPFPGRVPDDIRTAHGRIVSVELIGSRAEPIRAVRFAIDTASGTFIYPSEFGNIAEASQTIREGSLADISYAPEVLFGGGHNVWALEVSGHSLIQSSTALRIAQKNSRLSLAFAIIASVFAGISIRELASKKAGGKT